MKNKIISIGLFIDGGYYAKIDEALRNQMSMQLRVGALMDYIRSMVAEECEADLRQCQITEGHYFRGRYRAGDANGKHILLTERYFEDSLIENDIIFHYKHLREVRNGGSVTVIEKGVDVWFALETYELTQYRRFDYVVLITGDADHEMLAKKLKALKVNVVLLTWNLGPQSSTSPFLRDEVCRHIDLGNECVADRNLLTTLCKTLK